MVNSTKAVQLIKNTGILAIGSFSSKILVFLLVPLYTAVLTTGEYGSYDLISNTVGLLIPILTLNIQDALLRFPMDSGANISRICRIGLVITLASGTPVLAAQFVPAAPWRSLAGIDWLGALYISSALYQSLTMLARGLERMKDIAIAGVASSLILVLLNIVLLLCIKWGLNGYFAANVAAMLFPAVWLAWRMRDDILAPSNDNGKDSLLVMVRYSLPLAATQIGWWLVGTSDRYIVSAFCGMDANGLYSVAYRIPSILTVVSSIFLQAWQVSVVKDFDPEDSDGFLRKTFFSTEALVVLFCSVLIPISPLIASFMFSGQFYDAWIYVPPLLVYAAVNAMSGMWGPFYSAKYDPVPMAWSTVLGGFVNLGTGIPLVIEFGVQGACISSVLAGFVNWGYRAFWVRRHLEVSFGACRSLVSFLCLCVQAAVMCIGLPIQVWVPIEILFIVGFAICFRGVIFDISQFALRFLKGWKGV